MAKTAAERQAEYRARRAREGSAERRINAWISTEAYGALEHLASRYGVTRRALIETLLTHELQKPRLVRAKQLQPAASRAHRSASSLARNACAGIQLQRDLPLARNDGRMPAASDVAAAAADVPSPAALAGIQVGSSDAGPAVTEAGADADVFAAAIPEETVRQAAAMEGAALEGAAPEGAAPEGAVIKEVVSGQTVPATADFGTGRCLPNEQLLRNEEGAGASRLKDEAAPVAAPDHSPTPAGTQFELDW